MDNALIEKYTQAILHYIKLPIIVTAIIMLILMLIIIFLIKYKCFKDFILYVLLGVVAVIVFSYFTVFPVLKDINQNAFIEYSGAFYIEDYYFVSGGSSPYILIKTKNATDGVRYKITGNYNWIEKGKTYQGVFVYGENSKTILDMYLTK